MSTPCLIFVRSWIPRHRVNSYHFWTCIQALIKSASPLTTKKNTAFITSFRIFCYTKMAFGLKNDGHI
jgi:hypothetical protein